MRNKSALSAELRETYKYKVWTRHDGEGIIRGTHEGHSMTPNSKSQPTVDEMRQALGAKKMADGGLTWKSSDWKPHPENDLLQPIGASRMVGDEKLMSQDDTFSHGLSQFPSSKKSYRYLYHDEDKKPIGSMQIQTSGPRSKKAVIQNLYVAEDNRRQGIASKLLKRARQDFDVKHSTDLTSAGKAFAKAVKAEGGTVEPTVDQMREALASKTAKQPKHVKRLYHGTDKEFKRFNVGSYLTEDPDYASKHGKIVMPVNMSATKIKYILDEDFRLMADEPRKLKPYIDAGYDALASDAGGDYIILDPSKVKSAITHDAKGGTIYMAKGGSVKEPKNTVKAYKLFRVHKDHPGKLFPLFVDANTPVEMNKWVDAKEGDMKDGKVKSKIGALAYRPGWHAGDLPIATHIGVQSDPKNMKNMPPDRRPSNHAWAEVEMPDDVDWQAEATKRGTNAQGKLVPVKAHITDQIPKGGHYRYKTNPNMTGNWLIGGSMKVNKVLSDAEVARINKKAGLADLPRTEPFAKKTFGFAQGGMVNSLIAPEEFKAEEYVNYKAEGGKVEPTVDQMRQALINRHGLYSPLEKAALEMPRNKGTGAEFMAELSKRPGYKAEEIADRRIPIPEGKMTKAQFLEHLKKHSLPPLEKKIKGESTPKDEDQVWDRVSQEMFGVNADDLSERQFREVESLIPSEIRRTNPASQYEKYQLPGGKNYREVLLKLPRGRPDASKYSDPAKYDADMRAFNAKGQEDFQSSHWGNDPNVLAHMRMSDRTGPNGEKLLHLEEVQSDWHQAGRDKGYRDTANEMQRHNEFETYSKELAKKYGLNPNQNLAMYATMKGIDPTEVAKYEQLQNAMIEVSDKVPDAPFKKTWHEMALKHALHHAAKNGYDGMVITPGEEQAKRYDLSKQINTISWNKQANGMYGIEADTVNGRPLIKKGLTEKELEDTVGKEVASRIVNGVGQFENNPEFGSGLLTSGRLENLDLKVGGEGMKGFYDKMIPSYLNKLGKPHGAQVGQMPISFRGERRSPTESVQAIEDSGISMQDYHLMPLDQRREKFDYKTKTVPLHYLPINDQMRTSILKEGLPQYMRGGIVHKAEGGAVLPIELIKAQMMNRNLGLNQLQSIGAEEAPSMGIKAYVPPTGRPDNGQMPVGGVDTSQGNLPVGGIDMSKMQPGNQLMPNPAGQQPGMDQVPQGDKIGTMDGTGMPPTPNSNPNQMGSNILQMTPQGQAMAAMKPQGLAEGGSAKSIDEMKAELASNKNTSTEKRVTVEAPGAGGVKGIVVPKHLIEGNPKAGAEGLKNMMTARAKVYGEEHRDPLNLGQMAKIHKQTLAEHFAKPLDEQKKAEDEALNKIRAAKFIKHNRDTLDESEKLDTVEHEHDAEGRSHVGYASKGIAGHALYPKGHGKDMDYKVINTCPGQTEGCGGGMNAKGIVDTKEGTCFAPNAESQYAAAVSRRAGHAIAKHDPAMTKDWVIAHTGSMRNAANKADKQNKRMLFRPNVVDETDLSSRHIIRHLNEQRKVDDKPPIIANSYGKTNELHDPENGYHITQSNVGPKVKNGREVTENIGRDKARVRNTVMAADNQGDFKNEQGNKTPPKGSYMVTDVKRGSPMAKKMEGAITHAKYWTTGRPEKDLSDAEREEGPEGHFGGNGKPTTPERAHYGHTTHEGLRYDYQKQHVLHPRLVQVGKNDDGTPHMIPTDSRFMDTGFLPKNRYKTKNGKEAGHILMTTPTESTSNIGHQTKFTHNVNEGHIEHALKNNGEYEIDKPEDQAKAKGKEYAAPQVIKFQPKPKAYAMGGSVGGRHVGFSDDDFHAFPEQNVVAQRHLAMRGDDYEPVEKHSLSDNKRKVTMNKDMDTMLLELTRNKKAK
jgi:GNAT superfamily N-acetyltransferase